MVFHSYEFILGVLPACYIAFVVAHRVGGWQAAFTLLAVASLAFYAQFGTTLILALLASVLTNYAAGELIHRVGPGSRRSGLVLLAATAVNIGALVYFKYTNFLIDIANQVAGTGLSHLSLIVPVGVSFYTFIQIGYLIECHNGQAERPGLVRYVVFATFLPCVTAGPLVMQREMFEQMRNRTDQALDSMRLATGGTLFAIGLFKKVVLADSIAPFADAVFDGAAGGLAVGPLTAWLGSLCYALQLYFDFSGYSDMAIAIGCIFGLRLPLNFNSPFKATNISEFWRRWHMTMTRFFTSYVYTPLAMRGVRRALGGRYAPLRRFIAMAGGPVVVTFLIAGIWHGAGWTFVIYGLIHGFAIAISLAWREFHMPKLPVPVAWLLTMAVVVNGLVVFRAADLPTAIELLASMWAGGHFADAGAGFVDIDTRTAGALVMLLGAIVLLMPNSQQIMHRYWPSSDSRPDDVAAEAGLVVWKPTLVRSFAIAFISVVALASIGATSSFLYYQF